MRVNKTKFALMLALAGMTFACGGGDSDNGLPNPNKPILPGIKLNSGHKEIPANMNPNLCYMQVIEVGKEKIVRRNNQADPYMSILEVSVTNPDGSPAQGSVVFRIDETQIAGLQSLNERDHLGKPAGCNYDMQVNAALSESGKAQVVLMSRGKEDISQSTPVKVYASYNGVEDNAVVFIGPANKPPQGAGLELKVLDPYLTGSGGDRPSTLFDVLVSNIGGAPAPDPQYGIDNIKLSIDGASASQGSRLRFVDERGYTRSGSTITVASRDGKASVELVGGSLPSTGQGRSVTVSAWTDSDNNVSNGISNFSPVSYTFKVLNHSSDCRLSEGGRANQFDNDLGAIPVNVAYQSENFGYPCAVAPITQLPPDPQDWNNLPAGMRVDFNTDQATFRVLGTPTQLSRIDNVLFNPRIVEDKNAPLLLKRTSPYAWQPYYQVYNDGFPIPDVFTVKYHDAIGQVFKHYVHVVVVKDSYMEPNIGYCPGVDISPSDSTQDPPLEGEIITMGKPYSVTIPVAADPKADLQYVITGLPAGLSYSTGKDGIVISGSPRETCNQEIAENVYDDTPCNIFISVRDTYRGRLHWITDAMVYPYIEVPQYYEKPGHFNPNKQECAFALNIKKPPVDDKEPKLVITQCPKLTLKASNPFDFGAYLTEDSWSPTAHHDLKTSDTSGGIDVGLEKNKETPDYTIGYPLKFSVSGHNALKIIGEGRLLLDMGKAFGNSLDEILSNQTYTLTVTDAKGNSASKQCLFDAVRKFPRTDIKIGDNKFTKISPYGGGERQWLILRPLNKPLTTLNSGQAINYELDKIKDHTYIWKPIDISACKKYERKPYGAEVPEFKVVNEKVKIEESIDFANCFLLRPWNLYIQEKLSMIPAYKPNLQYRLRPFPLEQTPNQSRIFFRIKGTKQLDYYNDSALYDFVTDWFSAQSGTVSGGKFTITTPSCESLVEDLQDDKNKGKDEKDQTKYYRLLKKLGNLNDGATITVSMKLEVSEPKEYLMAGENPDGTSNPPKIEHYRKIAPNPAVLRDDDGKAIPYQFSLKLPGKKANAAKSNEPIKCKAAP